MDAEGASVASGSVAHLLYITCAAKTEGKRPLRRHQCILVHSTSGNLPPTSHCQDPSSVSEISFKMFLCDHFPAGGYHTYECLLFFFPLIYALVQYAGTLKYKECFPVCLCLSLRSSAALQPTSTCSSPSSLALHPPPPSLSVTSSPFSRGPYTVNLPNPLAHVSVSALGSMSP